jgi:hypothetical protein
MNANFLLNQFMSRYHGRELTSISRDIRAQCGISRQVLYHWRSGRTKIKKVYRDKITETLGEDIFGA